jgi:hypothetical protein
MLAMYQRSKDAVALSSQLSEWWQIASIILVGKI